MKHCKQDTKSYVNAVPSIDNNNRSFSVRKSENFKHHLEVLLQWQEFIIGRKIESEVTGPRGTPDIGFHRNH